MSLESRLREWLSLVDLQSHELLADLAAMNELFIIDGDSLILEALKNKIVDWSRSAGEYLQVIFLIESFLDDLIKKGASFQIIFFRSHQLGYYESTPTSIGKSQADPQSALLLRNSILGHMKRKTQLKIAEFDDWYCTEFATFIKNNRPSFLLFSPCNTGITTSQEPGLSHSFLMAAMALAHYSRGIALAFLSEVSYQDDAICAESLLPHKLGTFVELHQEISQTIAPHIRAAYQSLFGNSLPLTLAASSTTTFSSQIEASNVITQSQHAYHKALHNSGKNSSSEIASLVKGASAFPDIQKGGYAYVVAAIASKLFLSQSQLADDQKTKFAKAFLVHTVLSHHLAPQRRPQYQIAPLRHQPSTFHQFLADYTHYLCRIVAVAEQNLDNDTSNLEWNLVDIVDARLLASVARQLEISEVKSSSDLGFTSSMTSELDALWQFACSGSSDLLPVQSLNLNIVSTSNNTTNETFSEQPIRSAFIDSLLRQSEYTPVYPKNDEEFKAAQQPLMQLLELYHWEAKTALDYAKMLYRDKTWEEQRILDPSIQKKWIKMGQSLEARPNQSAVLQPKVLMRDEVSTQDALKALQDRLDSEKKPKTPPFEAAKSETSRVRDLANIWKSSTFARRITALAQFNPTTATAQFDWLYALLDIHIEQWRQLSAEMSAKIELDPLSIQHAQVKIKAMERAEVADQCMTMIVTCCCGLLEYQGTSILSERADVSRRINDILKEFKLSALAASFDKSKAPASTSDVPMENLTKYPADHNQSSAQRFQLARMGPWMKRDVRAVKDARSDRLLDYWQIDVLNCVDSYKSCLVVAPTSAGKSFMGFHAIKRVLETDDSVLVYVAPTKALVNQVVAEIYSKFSKTSISAGTVLCGAFTREFSIVPVDCRILVTVPTCLEVLLLSKELVGPKSWRERLRWVIFDEIHCIDLDEGSIWGRILPLIPCPFLALSATVGGIEGFKKWLERLAEAKLEYAHERKSLIAFSTTPAETPITTAPSGKGAKPLHPKLAAKAAKQQQGGKGHKGKGKDDKISAKQSPSSSGSATPAPTISLTDVPGYVKDSFMFINHPHRYSDLYKFVIMPRFFINGRLVDENTDPSLLSVVAANSTNNDPNNTKGSTNTGPKAEILTEFRPMHPWMGLAPSRFADGCPHSAFSPKECLKTYEAMAKYAHLASEGTVQVKKPLSAEHLNSFIKMKPEIYFEEGSIINQRHMRSYEADLKQTFMSWCSEYEDIATLVLKELTGDLIDDATAAGETAVKLGKDLGSNQFLEESLLSMVEVLKEQSWLPAIVFNFDPEVCEYLAKALCDKFAEKEANAKLSAEYRVARAKYADAMKEYEDTKRRMEKSKKHKKSKRNDEDMPKEGEEMLEMPVDPDLEMAEGTSLTRDGEVEILDDLKVDMKKLKDKEGVDPQLVDAIRRGIGVHHNGLPNKYRVAVEGHFRTGQLKIVFATETLALGMNMPCRTTIFAGDHPRLSPLQYRQMSGRAGRRGYDPLGRVVFWGIPIHRIAYLEGSHIAPIRGQFSMSFSFTLRSIILSTADPTGKKNKGETQLVLENAPNGTKSSTTAPEPAKTASAWDASDSESDDKPMKAWDASDSEEEDEVRQETETKPIIDAPPLTIPDSHKSLYASLRQVYENSLYLHKFPSRVCEYDIHTRCSLQYMLNLGLINHHGRPRNLAGLTSHLSWAEPSNIALCKILSSPYYYEMCKNWKNNWQQVSNELLLLFAHLFSRVPVPLHVEAYFEKYIAERKDKSFSAATCTHALFLPPLPKQIQDMIQQHNTDSMKLVTSTLVSYAHENRPYSNEKPEQWLHLSDLSHLSQHDTFTSGLAREVESTPVIVRSPLAALGGASDQLSSPADLRTLRHDLSARDFGSMIVEDIHGCPQKLNGYILDLWNYENYDWLIKHNKLPDSFAFECCQRFVGNLKSLKDAFINRIPESDRKVDPLSRSLTKLIFEFNKKFKLVFKIHRTQYYYIIVNGVEGYSADLQKDILNKTRISVYRTKRIPTSRPREYTFKISCRTEHDRARLIEMFDVWKLSNWWLDKGDMSDEEEEPM